MSTADSDSKRKLIEQTKDWRDIAN